MIIGIPDNLALEICVEAVKNQQTFGKLRLWIGGSSLGSDIGGNDLYFILNRFANPIDLDVRRQDTFLQSLPDAEVIDVLHRAIYEEGGATLPNRGCVQNLSYYRKFVLSAFDVEGFDDYFVAIAGATSGEDRIVWKNRSSSKTHSRLLSLPLFERTITSAIKWVELESGTSLNYSRWYMLTREQREERREQVRISNPAIAGDWYQLNERAAAALR